MLFRIIAKRRPRQQQQMMLAASWLIPTTRAAAVATAARGHRFVCSSVLLPNATSPLMKQHHQHQAVLVNSTTFIQARHFGKKKKNKGGSGGGNTRNMFKVYPAWGSEIDDIKDAMEYTEPEMIPATFDFKTLKRKFADALDMDETSEMKIYNSTTKKIELLTTVEQVHKEQNEKGKVFITQEIPDSDSDDDDEQLYDDDDYENMMTNMDDPDIENYDGPSYDDDMDNESPSSLKATIYNITSKLKENGWTPSKDGMMIMKNNNTTGTSKEKSTAKELVLALAMNDQHLQDILLDRIGALDHIVHCIHYEFVWNNNNDNQNNNNVPTMIEGE